MELILIRHAKAFDQDPAAWPDDLRRPLTAGGREAFARLAKRLARAGRKADVVLASPAVRTWQTARILHERAGWPEPQREERLAPGAVGDPATLLTELLAPRAGLSAVAFVGHEPDCSRLASWILSGHTSGAGINFRKGAALCVQLPAASAGRGRLQWMLTPRLCAGRRA